MGLKCETCEKHPDMTEELGGHGARITVLEDNNKKLFSLTEDLIRTVATIQGKIIVAGAVAGIIAGACGALGVGIFMLVFKGGK